METLQIKRLSCFDSLAINSRDDDKMNLVALVPSGARYNSLINEDSSTERIQINRTKLQDNIIRISINPDCTRQIGFFALRRSRCDR